MSRHLAVLMDPIARINPKKDTTFAMLLEAQRRGYRTLYMSHGDLALRDGLAWALAESAPPDDDRHHDLLRAWLDDSTIGEPSEVGISLWGAAKGLVQRTAIRNGQKNGVRVTAGSQLRIEDSLVEAVGHEYPAIMVDDRSHAIIARTQVRGGNSSITVDESEVALDSADLADASYCGIMLTKATLTTAATCPACLRTQAAWRASTPRSRA